MASNDSSDDSTVRSLPVQRRRFLTLLGVGSVGGLAGCSGGDDSSGDDGSSDDSSGDDGSSDDSSGDDGSSDDSSGDNGSPTTFNFALGSAPNTLDVHKTNRVPENIVLDAITDRLFHLNKDKEPVPQLVSEFERMSEASQYVFQLEEDRTYHNGDPFNAESAVWNLNRFLEVGSRAAILGDPDNIEATGEYELTMEYPNPQPRLPILLANWYTGFAPRSVVEEGGDDYGQTVVSGLGPFEFIEWNKGSNIRVEVSSDYDYGPEFASNRGPANVDEISFDIITEATTRISELTNGRIDGTSYVSLSDAQSVIDSGNTEFHENPFPYPAYFPMNMQKAPTDDIQVRKAIAHTIRRDPMVEAALSGRGTPIWALAPPNSVNGIAEDEAKELGYTHDLERARSLLDEAGWTNGSQGETRTKNGESLELTQLGFNLEQWSTQGEVAQQMLSEVGIDLTLEVVEGGTFYNKIENQEYHMITGGTGANFAADFLKNVFSSDQLGTQGGFNVSMYEDEQMDNLIDTALSAPSQEERNQAVRQAQELALEQAAYVPIMVVNRTYGHKNAVQNVDGFLEHDWWPNQYYLHHLEVDL